MSFYIIKKRSIDSFLLLITVGLVGCQTYQKQNFNPSDFLTTVEAERNSFNINNEQQISFMQAVEWMSRYNYEIKVLQAQAENLQKIADIGTPLANPEIEFGPTYFSNMDEAGAKRITPFLSVSFSIPLSNRIGRENNLKKLQALQAWQEVQLGYRKLYQDLRLTYIQTSLQQERHCVLKEVNRLTENSLKVLKELEAMGEVGALDIYEGMANKAYGKIDFLTAKETLQQQLTELSVMIGCKNLEIEQVQLESLPEILSVLPSYEELSKVLLENNPELKRIETEKNIYDAAYRLELAKQIPDLKLGTEMDQESDKTRGLSLSIGLEIPLFDRNQIAIAEARHQRDLTETRYKGTLLTQLARLDQLLKRYQLVFQKKQMIEQELLPLSHKALKMSEKGVKQGVFSALQWLKFQKDYRELLLLLADQKEQLWQIVSEIEQVVGYPIIMFDQEKEILLFSKEIKEEK